MLIILCFHYPHGRSDICRFYIVSYSCHIYMSYFLVTALIVFVYFIAVTIPVLLLIAETNDRS